MYELYFLIAILTNVLADLLIWREVKIMRLSHQLIRVETEAMKATIETATIDIKPLLNDHAARLGKTLGAALTNLVKKEKKAAQADVEAQIGDINDTVGGLGDLVKLVQSLPESSEKGNSGFVL